MRWEYVYLERDSMNILAQQNVGLKGGSFVEEVFWLTFYKTNVVYVVGFMLDSPTPSTLFFIRNCFIRN